PSVNVRSAGAPQAHHLDAKVPERLAVFERAAAILKARLPFAECQRRRLNLANRPERAPEVAEFLESVESALADIDCFAQSARDHVDLGQRRFGIGSDFVETGDRRDRHRLKAIIDRGLDYASGQYAQEAAPIVPRCTAARVITLLDQCLYPIKGRDMLGVLTESEFDLGLFEHG